jgi:phenylacetate-CoA ligase
VPFYNLLHNYIITPFADSFTGWNVRNNLRFLDASQWWSEQQLNDFQNSKLQELISFAYDHTLFYRNLFDSISLNPRDIKNKNDLRKIPVVTKELIRNNFPDALTNKSALKNLRYSKTATSGSTGRQLIYNITNEAYGLIFTAGLRGWYWGGFKLGDTYIKISQNKRHSILKKTQDLVNRGLVYSHEYNDEGCKNFIDIFKKVKPEYLRSYPEPLIFLSNYIRKKDIELQLLKTIFTTGNILTTEARELIESTFQTHILDSMSCEGSALFFECPTHTCYHVSDEYAITEIIDDEGNEVKPGETGRVVTTDLWNLATPFIRYETKDYVTKGFKCTCGRGLSTVTKIFGRDNDILITPQGEYLIAQSFTTYYKYFDSIEQFQVYQHDKTNLIFRLVVNKTFSLDIQHKIIQDWKTKLKGTMVVSIEIVEEIPLRYTGKRQFLIRNPNILL